MGGGGVTASDCMAIVRPNSYITFHVCRGRAFCAIKIYTDDGQLLQKQAGYNI